MNTEVFQQARQAYAARDYQKALQLYTQCIQDEQDVPAPGEAGQLYHQIGNCLVKLKNPAEAINAYSQATGDVAYDAAGSLNYNMGAAYASLHDYNHAVTHFETAVSDAKYDTPYKAYTGLGNAYLKLGKSAEAGVAFRNAALDEANPDPTKALLNLGVCFMALNRPADAVASYESALQFDMDSNTRNRLYANLGQAYVATGQNQKAVSAFDESLSDQTYTLSDSASVDYQRAVAAVAQGAGDTRNMEPVGNDADMSGLDVSVDGGSYASQDNAQASSGKKDPYYYADPYIGGGSSQEATAGEDHFFNASDEELEKWSRGVVKQDRKRRSVGLKIFVTLLVLLLLLLAAAAYLFWQGWGYPTQETVAQELFADPSAKNSVIADEVSDSNVTSMLAPLVEDDNITVNGVDRGMTNSTVYVTAKTQEGGDVQYKVSMVRDKLGWKVSNVELYFPSQN